MDNTETQLVISLCTGYGGLELGIERTGTNIQPIVYVEREAYAAANLVEKIEAGKMAYAPIWTDVKSFPAQFFRGKIHGIIGGYPCQPFSQAGKRQGEKDERHLWNYIREHIETIQPLWCFFENVSGHLTLGFRDVCESLRKMGYLVEAGLFTAAEVGFPHQRKRLFILAYTNQQRLRRRGDGVSRGVCGQVQATRPSQLDNAESTRYEAGECQREQKAHARLMHSSRNRQWVAAPNEPQHEWEHPRTVKSPMGRTTNGYSSWVDEIRLCGNGVVPDTAALAWKTLTNRITGDNEQ